MVKTMCDKCGAEIVAGSNKLEVGQLGSATSTGVNVEKADALHPLKLRVELSFGVGDRVGDLCVDCAVEALAVVKTRVSAPRT